VSTTTLKPSRPALLDRTVPFGPVAFGLCRIALGVYLAVHFLHLLPYAGELFGHRGLLPDPGQNLIPLLIPNPLASSLAWMPSAVILLGALSGIGLAFGRLRPLFALSGWLVWAWVFGRNNLIINPGIPYVGLLLLVCAILPAGEAFVPGRTRNRDWRMPALVWWMMWLLLAVGYTFSGYCKLASPSWIDGSALLDVMQNPLARDGLPRDLFLSLPTAVQRLATWGALGLELAFLPLALIPRTRRFVWAAMLLMHLGIMTMIHFADLSLGMVLIHLFTLPPTLHFIRRSQRTQTTQPKATHHVLADPAFRPEGAQKSPHPTPALAPR